ncbi:MAG: tail fiber protein [Paracoccus sp. (in: a-proteobacteria)]
MPINNLTVFAENGEKNTTGLNQSNGFPTAQKPARQWFNWLFNTLTSKINELVAAANSTESNLDDKADQVTTISAGNGLTGGGSLAANRTLTLGTPGQITASSTNATTTTSHTHAIDSASTSREGIVQLNDSLTSTSTVQALTAKQGKVLKDLIDDIDVTAGGIGINQSWVDVTSSRAKETTYTNNTSSPIQVLISLLSHDDNTFTAVYVGSVKIMHLYFDISDGGGHGTTPAAFIVPPGDTYRVTGNANLDHWAELR